MGRMADMKIWIVDTGAYESNHIDSIFFSEDSARTYAKSRNDEADESAKSGKYRSVDDSWDVTDYDTEDEPGGGE